MASLVPYREVFDRETLLDISVNLIPMAIIAFFVLFFLGVYFRDPDPFATVLMVGLHVVPFVLLAILTYVSAILIEGDGEQK
jgi:hypothetical protein